jgi:hypothetical protein
MATISERPKKKKTARAVKLMTRVRDEKIKISLRLANVCLGPVAFEIASLCPHTISWSNVIDYFLPPNFHELARACSTKEEQNGTGSTTKHVGYSMNWPVVTFGVSIVDFESPAKCMEIIENSNETYRRLLTAGRNRRNVFAFPLRRNPENTTAHTLSVGTYKRWVDFFFRESGAIVHKDQLEELNPLHISVAPVSLAWAYSTKERTTMY